MDDGPRGAWAESVLANGSLYAPELVCAEVTNVLRRLEKTKLISVADANAGHDDLMRLDIHLFPYEPFADRIWELRHDLTGYDGHGMSRLQKRSDCHSRPWTVRSQDRQA